MTKQKEESFGVLQIVAPVLLLLAGVAAFVILKNLKAEPKAMPKTETPLFVVTAKGKAFHEEMRIQVSGLVVPFREIELSAQVAGIIKFKNKLCRSGNFVTEGTVLIELDKEEYEIEVERLEAEVAQAQSNIDELGDEIQGIGNRIQNSQREVELLHLEFERLENLGTVVTKTEREAAERVWVSSKNNLLTLENQNRVFRTRQTSYASAKVIAEKSLARAQLELSRTSLVAPSDGVIVDDPFETGTFIQKGTTLLLFEDTSKAEVSCNLQADELYWILRSASTTRVDSPEFLRSGDHFFPPTQVEVVFEFANEVIRWQGMLSRFEGSGIDSRTHSIPCRVVVDQPVSTDKATFRTLVRGMFVDVNIDLIPPEDVFEISALGLRPDDFLWTVKDHEDEEGRLSRILAKVKVVVLDTERKTDTIPEDFRSETVIVWANGVDLSKSDIVNSPVPASTLLDSEVQETK